MAALTILIVDDNDFTRRSLARLLTTAGHTVTSAGCFADALEIAKHAAIDVLVTDLWLGSVDYDGLELLAALRRSGWKGRVILVSGGLLPAESEYSFDVFLPKPFAVSDLLRAIEGR